MATTKKAVAKRGTATPATEVIEGVIVEEGSPSPDFEVLEAIQGGREAAAAYAKKYIAEFHADILTGERATVKAAKAAYGAVAGGWAIDGDTIEDGQITLSDLGQMLADGVEKRRNKKDPTKFDAYSKSMVSGYRNAGEAFARGIDPASTLGRALLARYAQFGPIRKAIQAPDMTVESVQQAVDAKKAEESKPKTKPEGEVTVTPAEPKTPLEKIQAALAGLSKEDMHKVLAEAAAWVDSDSEAEVTAA